MPHTTLLTIFKYDKPRREENKNMKKKAIRRERNNNSEIDNKLF